MLSINVSVTTRRLPCDSAWQLFIHGQRHPNFNPLGQPFDSGSSADMRVYSLASILSSLTVLSYPQACLSLKFVPNLDPIWKFQKPFSVLAGCATTLECCAFALGRKYPPQAPYLYTFEGVMPSGTFNEIIFNCRDQEDSHRVQLSRSRLHGPYFQRCPDDMFLHVYPFVHIGSTQYTNLGICLYPPHELGPTLAPGVLQCINILPPARNKWLSGWVTSPEGLRNNGTIMPAEFITISEYGGRTLQRQNNVGAIQMKPDDMTPGTTYRICAKARHAGPKELVELHAVMLPSIEDMFKQQNPRPRIP